MTKDLNKGISNISYNLLNLPQQVDINSPLAEATNRYSYSADGVKLRVGKTYNSGIGEAPIEIAAMFPDGGESNPASYSTVTSTTDYVGNKLFENGTLERILVDGGYIKNGTYYFYETDHLGSNRLTVSQTGAASDRSDYYPYGMQMAHNQLTNSASGSDNKRKFSGKELDVMHGLNLYDFSARSQDPTLGRFTTVDPKAEKYYSISPYAYCGNNPIRLVDVNGKEWGIIVNANGTMTITLNTTISSGSNLNLTAAQLDAYKTAISTQLNSTISEASGGLISASVGFDGAKDPSRYTPNISLSGTSSTIGFYAMGQNTITINPLLGENMQEVAETVSHELFHTLALGELSENFSINGILDTQLNFDKTSKSYTTTSATDKDLLSNIMNYGYIKIDNVSYKEMNGSNVGMNKLTKGQLNFIIQSIYKQMAGYGLVPTKESNESNEEYQKRFKEMYSNYWGMD